MSTEELSRRFARKNGAIFVGAGLSMGIDAPRFPSWIELVAPLRVKLGIPASELVSPEQIAGWFEAMEKRDALVDHFRATLPRGCKPSPSHKLVASLPVELYFTTNFDDVLERALLEQTQSRPAVIVKDTDLADYPGQGKVLVKLHGDLEDADYMVATRQDYDRYLEKRPGIVEMMRLALMSRTVLFIGYSFNDYDLRLILSQVGTRMGKLRRKMYATQINPSAYVTAELKRYDVEVIPLMVPAGGLVAPVLESWLSEFCRSVERRRHADLSACAIDATSNLPLHCTHFIGREDEIAKICHHLAERRMVALHGAAGVGKSTLVIEIARRCALSRTNELGISCLPFVHTVYIDARNCHDEVSLQNKVFNEIASVLRFDAIRQQGPHQFAEKAAQIAALLGMFRVLVILDHADGVGVEDADDFWTWASNIPYPSLLLIVTKDRCYKFATAVPVGGFGPSDAQAFLEHHAGAHQGKLDEEDAAAILRLSGGAADGILLLLGQHAHGRRLAAVEPGTLPQQAIPIDMLLEASWDLASSEAREMLIAASVFHGKTTSREALQAGADMTADEARFERAVAECTALFLLARQVVLSAAGDTIVEYCLDPSTATFGARRAGQMGEWGREVHQRVAHYFTNHVRACLVRPEPAAPYWNVLASSSMRKIDTDWPTLRRILDWAVSNDRNLLVRLVFLLVHYLDVHMRNQDRLRYVETAVLRLHELGRVHDEALLRIDALGWTLIEERRIDDAKDQIRHGLLLLGAASPAERADLIPLGDAWLARAYAEQGRMNAARALIRRARRLCATAAAWIVCRVCMVEGDIWFRTGDFGAALERYLEGQRLARSYGGEEEYQWLPRIGMAYLRNGQLELADDAFRQLMRVSEDDHIAVGILYAKYGMAQLELRRNRTLGVHLAAIVEQIRVQLARSSSSQVMIRLLDAPG